VFGECADGSINLCFGIVRENCTKQWYSRHIVVIGALALSMKKCPTIFFHMQDKTNEAQNLASSNHREAVIPEGYYSEKEVAGFLGKTIGTLRTDHCHRRNRVPPKKKLGRIIVYSKTSFAKWLESIETKPFKYNPKLQRFLSKIKNRKARF
jgi:hypothetical protein